MVNTNREESVLEKIVAAPEVLGLDEREPFRRTALELLEGLASGGGALVVDLSATRSVDSAGLGVLLLIQRRAGERRIRVVLREPSSEVRFLLMVTRLDGLFDIDPPGAEPR